MGVVCYDADFYPFGGERIITSSSGNSYKFTGKERDAESGLDEFGARYYSSALGRFTIPDWAAKPTAVPNAVFGNPQSLNLYSYAKNNPLNESDPDGHDSVLDNIIRTAGGTNSTRGETVLQIAIGGAKGVINTAIKAVNTISTIANGGLPGLTKPQGNQVPEIPLSNKAQALGAQIIPPVVLSAAGTALEGPGATGVGLSDSALVVRGGVPTPAQLTKGAEAINADGTLSGVSVNSANGATVQELSQGIPNAQVGVTTVGDVRAAGGDVVPTPQPGNPCHCDMNGLTAEDASKLLKTQPNPSKIKTPQSQ